MASRLAAIAALCVTATSAIAAQEASFSRATFAGYELEWRVVGDELELRFSQQTTGWVALGFKPSRMMRDANILIGYVDGSEIVVEDHYGTRNTAHSPDVRIGGTRDVRVIGGSERNGRTTLHVAIPLDSGDDADQPLAPGEQVRVIYSWGRDNADNTSAYHAGRGGTTIEIR